jgi:hypothetical protein
MPLYCVYIPIYSIHNETLFGVGYGNFREKIEQIVVYHFYTAIDVI